MAVEVRTQRSVGVPLANRDEHVIRFMQFIAVVDFGNRTSEESQVKVTALLGTSPRTVSFSRFNRVSMMRKSWYCSHVPGTPPATLMRTEHRRGNQRHRGWRV